ncbi:hypothetical protein T06_13747 [Trichinella sp. T6]|nr:hypothetical protein T06_13747 [Trichinella sp. T6]
MLLPALRLGVNSDSSYTVRTLRAGAHITNSTGIRSRAFSRICTHGLVMMKSLMKTMLPPMREENITSDVDGRSDPMLISPNELRLLFLIYISLVVSLMGLGCKEKRLCNSKLPKRKGHVEDNYHAK